MDFGTSQQDLALDIDGDGSNELTDEDALASDSGSVLDEELGIDVDESDGTWSP